jgi:hypothetical protein
MACATRAVGGDRPLVRDGLPLGADQLLRLPWPCAQRVEDRPVRLLRRVREVAVEAVEENRSAAIDEREGLAPEAQREAQGEVGRQQWVRPLARQVWRRPRDTDHDRVEALVERRRTGFDCA